MTGIAHQRSRERQELKAKLLTGVSILMLAPRRIGKTWLIERIAEDMRGAGWLCISVDVEGMRTEEEFLQALCAEIEKTQDLPKRIWSQISQRFKQLRGNAEGDLKETISKVNPREFVETLIEGLNKELIEGLNKEERRTLILVDEIALFVLERVRKDPDGARSLLYHLRKLQQSYKKVSWFLTGSIGLDVIARRHDLHGAMLGYDTYELLPFTGAAARSYIDDLCARGAVAQPFDFGDGAFECLANELGWLSPYYLRQIADLVRPTGQSKPDTLRPVATAVDISNAAERLLSPNYRMHFSAWQEHITKNFEKDERQRLKVVLDIACDNVEGEIEATFLTRLQAEGLNPTERQLKDSLLSLGNDGYLTKSGDRWKFRSGLLRSYWQEYAK